MADPLILARFVHFAATVLAAGTIGFTVLVAEPAVHTAGFKSLAKLHRQLTVWVSLALAVAVISGAAWLVLLASDILGTSIADVCLHGGAWPVLTDTRFGLVWCIRFALALSLAVLIAVAGDAMVSNYHRGGISCFARIGRPRRRNAGPGGGPPSRLGYASFARRGRLARWPAGLRIPPLARAPQRWTAPGRACGPGGRSFLAARCFQRRNFAGERPRQQLEPAERATRLDSFGLWAPGGTQDRPVRGDGRDRGGQQILPDAAPAQAGSLARLTAQ